MNNRDYKQFRAGHYYHVYNRGTGKMNIFRDQGDYKFMLLRLNEIFLGKTITANRGFVRKVIPEGAFSLVSYCLMPNHFHFLIRQNTDLPISTVISKLCTSYSKYFNKKFERVGSLFQGAFKSIVIDSDSYLIWLASYIHLNPKTAGIVTDLASYSWSSYPDYAGIRNGQLIKKDFLLGVLPANTNYANFVDNSRQHIEARKDFDHLFLDND